MSCPARCQSLPGCFTENGLPLPAFRLKRLTRYSASPKRKLSGKHETGEWIADRLHAMTFFGRFSCGCCQTEQMGRSVPFRGKKDKRPDLMEDCNGKCPSPSFVLKRTAPESGDRIFQAPTGNIPTCFPFFSSCRNPCQDSVDSVDSFFRSGSAFFQNRTADSASSRTTAGLPDASLAGSERICLNRLAPGRPVIMPSMWRVIPCIFRPFSP